MNGRESAVVTSGWLKRAALPAAAFLFALVGDPTAAKDKLPEKFPPVALAPNSSPRYLTVESDLWTNKPAFLLFDGDVTNGYRRLYVWSPENPEFAKPVALNVGEKNRFESFRLLAHNPSNANDSAVMAWAFGWTARTSGAAASSATVFDYVEGKMVTVSRAAVATAVQPIFWFNVTFRRGPRASVTGSGSGQAPLDLVITGEAGSGVPSWSNVTAGGAAPWNRLTLGMPFKSLPDKRDKEKEKLAFTAALYYGNYPCQIMSLPKESTITLTLNPYMEPPLFSNTLSAIEVFSKGITAEIPYGWYEQFYWLQCPGLAPAPGWVALQPYPKPAGIESAK
jgi:hypothetical protein